MVVTAFVIGIWLNARAWTYPSRRYQRVFSVAAAGLVLFVPGLVGLDMRYSRGWFRGVRWVEGPVWWQVGVGLGFLVLAGFLARRADQAGKNRRDAR